MPATVTRVGDWAVHACNSLKTAGPIGGGYDYEFGWTEEIPSRAFDCIGGFFTNTGGLSSVTIPDTIHRIGSYAFSSNQDLFTVTIPFGVTNIETETFYGCNGMTSITIPKSVTNIESRAFCACDGMIDVYFSGTEAEWNAITMGSENEALANATIHFTSTSKNYSVAYDANGGTGAPEAQSKMHGIALTLSNVVPTREDYNFLGWATTTSAMVAEYQPGDSFNIDEDTTLFAVWGNFNRISGSCGENAGWTLEDGILTITGSGEMNDWYSPWKEYSSQFTAIIVEEGITHIGASAFSQCQTQEHVIIPDGVISVGEYAFDECENIRSISLPSSFKTFGDYAFAAFSLENIFVSEQNTLFCDIDGVLYSKDKTVLMFYPRGREGSYVIPIGTTEIAYAGFRDNYYITSITIPDTVTSIGEWAFGTCSSLKSIRIPISVSIINDDTFWDCFGLTDIYYGGTETDWNMIRIGVSNEALDSAIIHFVRTPDFVLPTSITTIESEAFTGTAFSFAKLSDKTTSIGTRAFADCPILKYIYIPATTKTIAADAFAGVEDLTIFGTSGSYAETYAAAHGHTFIAVP